MSDKPIRRLKIANFKSIDALEIMDLSAFSVFAGSNGSGKSNFFDALDFVSLFLHGGIRFALNTHGGFANIHSVKRHGADSKKFCFEIECDLCEDQSETPSAFHYSLCIHNLDRDPYIEEFLHDENGKIFVERKGEEAASYNRKGEWNTGVIPHIYSALWLYPNHPITLLLRNLNVYRIEPTGAKEPDISDFYSMRLERKGHNLASVLQLRGQSRSARNILDWMEMIVPGIENIQTEQQRLDGSTALLFKEKRD